MDRKRKSDLARKGRNCVQFSRIRILKCWEAINMAKEGSWQMFTDRCEEREKESKIGKTEA